MSQISRSPEGGAPPGDSPELLPAMAVGTGAVPTARVGGSSAVRTRSWVGIVANRGAGQGKGRQRVSRLVRDLRREGIRSRVAWTVDGRARL
ncbi:MAG: hypothetical protein U0790_27750, partial [Isosphaeraceae bacterium]